MVNHQFRKLLVWQKAMEFVIHVYDVTSRFPSKEQFGLTDQIRRAAISISLNIAEGSGSGNVEFCRFLYIARRSAYEVITGFEIAVKLKYGSFVDSTKCIKESEEICSMIVGLIKKLKSS